MKIAVTASSDISLADLAAHLPQDAGEIIPAGTWGAGENLRRFADTHGIKLTEFIVEYEMFGPSAMMEHFMRVIDYADQVIIFPDSSIPQTDDYIGQCRKQRKPLTVAGLPAENQ